MQGRAESAVIEFPLERVRPAGERAAAAAATSPAQVLIFTGVRIERMYDLAERLSPLRTG